MYKYCVQLDKLGKFASEKDEKKALGFGYILAWIYTCAHTKYPAK
jgi:hypothetical protein